MNPILKYSFSLFLVVLCATSCESIADEVVLDDNQTSSVEKEYFINAVEDTIVPGKFTKFNEVVLKRDSLPKGKTVKYEITGFDHPSDDILIHYDPVFIGKMKSDTIIRNNPGEFYPAKPRKLETTIPDPILLENPSLIKDKRANIYSLTSIHGLPENEINDLALDKNGNIWLGHTNGISHIIGDKCFYYGNETGLDIPYIYDIFCSSKNEIWAATNTGLLKFDGTNFWIYDDQVEIPDLFFVCIDEDKDGNIWTGTYDYGVAKITEDGVEHYPFYEGENYVSVLDISSNENRLLFATSIGLAQTIAGEDKITHKKLPAPYNDFSFISIFESRNGDIWLNNWGRSLLKISQDSVWDYSNIFDVRPTYFEVSEDVDGSIWLASVNNGIFHLTENNQYEVFGQKEGIAENGTGNIIPTEDAIYFSSGTSGLLYQRRNTFRTNFKEDFGDDISFYDHILDQNNNYWSVLRQRKVLMFNDQEAKQFDFTSNDYGTVRYINYAISPDSNEYLFSSRYGIITIKDGVAELLGEEQGILNNSADYFFKDTKGRTWVSTNHSGIYWFNDEEIHQFSTENGFPVSSSRNFYETSNGDIWFTGGSNGPVRYNDHGFEFIAIPNGKVNDNDVRAMCFDEEENLWFTSQSKLYLRRDSSIHEIGIKDGILGGKYLKLFFSNEQIWLFSSKGISIIKEVPVGAADITIEDTHYSINNLKNLDGLPTLPSRLHNFFMNDEGELFWSSMSFVSRTNTSSFITEQKRVLPRIISINTKEKVISNNLEPFTYIPKDLVLEPENNDVTFIYSSGDIWNQHKVLFSYQLIGLDEDWSDPSTDRKATFKNLGPGEYTFQLKTKFENAAWSDHISYTFSIMTPWYATAIAKFFYFVFGILFIYLIIQLRTRKLKKQKEQLEWEVEKATHQIQEKHNEIQDSIAYAKRIQLAILPSTSMMEKHLPEHYIIYKPKDVVAGDFYWLEEHNNETLFAAADCTGHGVPGAMVSVVCHNSLNRAVHEYGLTKPSLILDKARELVIDTFNKNDFQVNDGMDIALCSYNKSEQKLKYSGANNSLYIISDGELSEIKPTKQPVGRYENAQPFIEHEVDIKTGDTVFLFSDGYADQFGGNEGKKLKYKNFKALLIRISQHPFNKQSEILNDYFDHWKGDFEQLDDVCIMAVKF